MFSYGYFGGGYNSFGRNTWSDYLDDYGYRSPFSSTFGNFGGFGGGFGNSFGSFSNKTFGNMLNLMSSFDQIKDIQDQILEIAYLTGDQSILQDGGQYQYQAPTGTTETSKEIDINKDGKTDVKIAGQNAEELAEYVRQITEQNPEMAQLFLDKAAKNADSICYIDIQDLGGTTAGASRLDENGKAWGSMFIDDTWQEKGIDGLANTLSQVLTS